MQYWIPRPIYLLLVFWHRKKLKPFQKKSIHSTNWILNHQSWKHLPVELIHRLIRNQEPFTSPRNDNFHLSPSMSDLTTYYNEVFPHTCCIILFTEIISCMDGVWLYIFTSAGNRNLNKIYRLSSFCVISKPCLFL